MLNILAGSPVTAKLLLLLHMKSINTIVANRLLKKEKANAYYSHFPFIEAFSKFELGIKYLFQLLTNT